MLYTKSTISKCLYVYFTQQYLLNTKTHCNWKSNAQSRCGFRIWWCLLRNSIGSNFNVNLTWILFEVIFFILFVAWWLRVRYFNWNFMKLDGKRQGRRTASINLSLRILINNGWNSIGFSHVPEYRWTFE